MSNIDTFTKNFEEIFDDVPVGLTSASAFRDLEEWDSMAALSLIAMLDEKYGVNLTIEELKKANTVEELFSIVNTRA